MIFGEYFLVFLGFFLANPSQSSHACGYISIELAAPGSPGFAAILIEKHSKKTGKRWFNLGFFSVVF